MCYYSVEVSLKIAYTKGNFGLRFFGCVNHKFGRSCKFFRWYDPLMCCHGRRVLRHLREKHERVNMEATSSVATEQNIASKHTLLVLEVTQLRREMESIKSKHQ
ncbi:hypothetical protein CJ030_MR7G009273 [Morella rubra]|uniref:Zinc finger GRF-type domain-containing protein n=1 Tax=Morella rubra TaxID=262757 RepID=A0A6A1V038_9ROSI|nr:hypothetical protein CJ030_MR7G009267 [Morella rubra]KAB1206044.1 hypothetical protein CJ030_MR7G009273 [Morella rubra]